MNDRAKALWAEHKLPVHPPAIGANFDAPEGDVLMRDAAAAMNGIAGQCAKALDTARLIFDDDSLTVPSQHLKVREVAASLTKTGFSKLSDVINGLQNTIDGLSAATMAPKVVLDPRQEIRRGIIAQALKGTAAQDRNEEVIGEIKAGNVDLADAILNLPGIVTGYSKIDREYVREVWRRTHCAEQAERLDQLKGVLEHARHCDEVARSHLASLWGAGIVAQAERKSKAVAEAIEGAAE